MHALPPNRPITLPAAVGLRRRRASVATELRYLVRSAEPAVVFSSLAHLCVPAFSDACTIDIVERGELAYRIAHFRSDLAPAGTSADTSADPFTDWSVCTPFASAGMDADAGYVGVMTHQWRSRRPTVADKARAAMLARQCVAAVAEERHLGFPECGADEVDQPRVARRARAATVTRPGWGCGAIPGQP